MLEVRLKNNEDLETAFEKLKQAGKRQVAFMRFKGKTIYSNISLDEAYFVVYGCSKSNFEIRQNQAKLVPDENEEKDIVFDDKASDVIRDLRTAILINDVDPKTGLYHSEVALNYIIKMSMYAKYCIEETKEEWKKTIIYYVYSVGRKKEGSTSSKQAQEAKYIVTEPEDDREDEFSDSQIRDYLDFFEKIGTLMKAIAEGKSWAEINRQVKLYNFSKDDTESLKECILHYCPKGEEFVKNVFGKGPLTYKNN